MCLCTHKHPQTFCTTTTTHTHTHTDSDTHVHHCLPEWRNTVYTVIHTPSELNQRFHLEGKHQAPLLPPITGAWKRSQQPPFYTITSSGRKSAPLFRFCFELCSASQCFSKSHLNYHILKERKNDLSSLWKRILYNFAERRPPHYSFSCNTFSEIKRIS